MLASHMGGKQFFTSQKNQLLYGSCKTCLAELLFQIESHSLMRPQARPTVYMCVSRRV